MREVSRTGDGIGNRRQGIQRHEDQGPIGGRHLAKLLTVTRDQTGIDHQNRRDSTHKNCGSPRGQAARRDCVCLLLGEAPQKNPLQTGRKRHEHGQKNGVRNNKPRTRLEERRIQPQHRKPWHHANTRCFAMSQPAIERGAIVNTRHLVRNEVGKSACQGEGKHRRRLRPVSLIHAIQGQHAGRHLGTKDEQDDPDAPPASDPRPPHRQTFVK